ncbi:MAG: ABC transporter ATP-binding protein [Eubacteriales bacterium]|nr:ABC transporter ATP-binding protein [Eubacteriales bacterium]
MVQDKHESTDTANEPAKNPSALKMLMFLFTRREKWQITILSIFSLLTAIIQSTGVFSLMPFINIVMNMDSIHENTYLKLIYDWFEFTDDNRFIIFLGSIVIGLLIISGLMASITSWLKNRFVLNINYGLSYRLLSRYLSNSYEFFLQSNSSELGMNILGNVNSLGSNYLANMIEIIISSFMTLALIGTLLLVDFKTTLAMFLFFGLTYGGLTVTVRTRLLKSGQLVNQFNRERHRSAHEALNGIKITKALNLEDYFLNRYKKAAKKYTTYQSFAKLISDIPNFAMETLVFSAIIITIIVLILRGYDIDAFIPTVSLFAFAGYRLMPALSKIFRSAITLYHNQPILERVYVDMQDLSARHDTKSIQDRLDQTAIHHQTDEPLSFDQDIKLINVDFYYKNSSKIIDQLSLTIRRNSVVGFAGTTGAGKTTLIDIFLGLLHPASGEFRIDDVLITEENVQSWRQLIGYVPQDIFLIDDTILKNIAFGVPEKNIDLEMARKAARIAAIDDFIENQLKDGYQTQVGERGVRLSGGQRQRIGLARALYRSPSVLILDEATSALDGTTEEKVLTGIHTQSSVKTMLIIAHRLNTLKVCDDIYLLENGRIIDHGNYDFLITHNPKFMKMAKVE